MHALPPRCCTPSPRCCTPSPRGSFTGADISALVREAAMSALEEDLQAQKVEARHFDLALLRVRPSAGPGADVMAMYSSFQRHSSGLAAG